MNYAKIGAVFFVLWGLLHIVGGGTILLAVGKGSAEGFAIYGDTSATYTALSGGVLGYLAYFFVAIAILVTFVGVRYNWYNSQDGLTLNTVLVGLTDLGLIMYLVWPGFVSWGEAAPGLILFAGGAIFGGIACQSAHSNDKAAS